ncbi:MAG: AbrB/MazE/SpoVT family DNA-binding domain-containing protein [Candidatus Bathyarchaeota archaeon]|jgi:bifunctional DNA-binding transcriptional regulator/antitoxin component of YhaV-PrlF toxin-antitoxin module|nr:AbrB/MazE/SpoVT family DNA-binding domain-containing protein [Candidatus Bathyarchaeota archaeon]
MEIVTAYQASQPDSLVVVIPKRVREKLKITKGKRFIVKIDEKDRIIYEPVKKEANTNA